MRITRVIAVSLGLGILGGAAGAQTLANASPPAEFPPASYKGKQYVDSRGCVYIRAGIDGNVTWVPRVTRNRKQVCGYQPSLPNAQAALPSAPAPRDDEVVEIRNDPQPSATATATAPAAQPKPSRPRRQAGGLFGTPRKAPSGAAKPSAGPAPTVFNSKPAPKATPKPKRVARPVMLAPAPAPAAASTPARVPRRPAPEPTVVLASPSAPAPQVVVVAPRRSASNVSERTRVVRRHIYEARQGWINLPVPSGYKTVWEDDRLNPRRAERDLRPNLAQARPRPPQGYREVWEDQRLNDRRAAGTANGEAAMDRVWQRTMPRQLVKPPRAVRIVTRPNTRSKPNSPYWETEVAARPAQQQAELVTRVSTRSAPVVAPVTPRQTKAKNPKPSYVRVATYGDDASARSVARALARQGLPMRLGSLKRNGATLRVVMAGPFATAEQANSALRRLNKAGYKARLLR